MFLASMLHCCHIFTYKDPPHQDHLRKCTTAACMPPAPTKQARPPPPTHTHTSTPKLT
jgi:hypothetical protein